MFRFGKTLINSSIKFVNNNPSAWTAAATGSGLQKFSPFSRNMETFASTWESDIGKAIEQAKYERKPIMLVVYRPWCNYCQNLSKQISNVEELKEMKKFFVMAQVNEDETYLDNKFAPDNGVRYVPRVLFLTPNGDVMKDVRNQKAQKDGTLYVYNEVNELMDSMNDVVKKYFMANLQNARSNMESRAASENVESNDPPSDDDKTPPEEGKKRMRKMKRVTIVRRH